MYTGCEEVSNKKQAREEIATGWDYGSALYPQSTDPWMVIRLSWSQKLI